MFFRIILAPKLNFGFLPDLREGHFMIHTSSITGTSLSETMRIGDNISSKVLQIEGVKTLSQWAGRAERGKLIHLEAIIQNLRLNYMI